MYNLFYNNELYSILCGVYEIKKREVYRKLFIVFVFFYKICIRNLEIIRSGCLWLENI